MAEQLAVEGIDYIQVPTVEMSSLRRKKGELFISLWVTGPRGGLVTSICIDLVEAAKLSAALTKTVHKLKKGGVR